MFNWMGRYAPLIAALIKHSNIITKNSAVKMHIYENIYLTTNAWQILEYIVDNRDQNNPMIHISEKLGIPQSSFSKVIAELCQMGLVEKYKLASNKKNIILKPTALALEAYTYHTQHSYQSYFKRFFEAMEGFSDDELERFTQAISILSKDIVDDTPPPSEENPQLIKIE